jgi:hypothetical protein
LVRSRALLRLGIPLAARSFVLSGLILAACSSKASQVTKVIERDGGGAAPPAGTGSGEGGADQGGMGGANGGESGENAAGEGGIGEAGAVGAAGAAGSGPCTDPGAPDTFMVSACGDTPGTTAEAYSGVIVVTVSGTMMVGQYDAMDAFYGMHPDTLSTSRGDCPDCLRYNRVSEGDCVCSLECSNTSHRLADLVIGSYPEFSAAHEYMVEIDLGNMPPERLNIGVQDCGCADNSGELTVTVTRPGGDGCTP